MSSTYLPRIPITVLTGFLGSGKTTLLARLIRSPEMARTAVIINEFGEVGLDHLLVTKADENTVLMDSGCICCTIRSDLSETLRDLHRRRITAQISNFDRVVIETTGLADPAPILHTLMTDPVILGYFKLEGIATTVDAIHGTAQLQKQEESVRQAAVADRLILTKTDLASAASTALLRSRLAVLNPAAEIVDAVREQDRQVLRFDDANYSISTKTLDVARWLNAEAYGSQDRPGQPASASGPGCEQDHDHEHDHPNAHRHGQTIGSFCLIRQAPIRWGVLVGFLEALTRLRGTDLLRVKGLVNVAESDLPVVIQGVEHLFHPPSQLDAWPDTNRRTRIVFIGKDLPQEGIEELLSACEAAATT